MKLQTKKEITKAKSLEREVEIREGVKLAKKVDSLREKSAKEQDNMIKFRNETIKKVKHEIDEVIAQREVLKEEVYSLEKQKQSLSVPLDEEWEKITLKQEELTKFGQELNDKHLQIKKEENEQQISQKLICEEKLRIEEEHRISIKNLAESEKKNDIALKLVEEAENQVKIAQNDAQISKQSIIDHEVKLAILERDLKNKEKSIDDELIFIREEKIRLTDQRQTLERAMVRIKKN